MLNQSRTTKALHRFCGVGWGGSYFLFGIHILFKVEILFTVLLERNTINFFPKGVWVFCLPMKVTKYIML